jgi:hypothetical protein
VDAIGSDDGETVRLVQIGGDFCDQLIRCNADRGAESGARADFRLDVASDVDGVAFEDATRRDVEKSFVQ